MQTLWRPTMAEEKSASGKWQWLQSDTVEQFTNIAIYGLSVGGVAVLEKVQVMHFENQMVTAFIGLAAGYAIDAIRRWGKDNAKP